MQKTTWFLVSKAGAKQTALICATSRKDARQYNASVSGLGGTLTKLDRPPVDQPGYFMGVYVTPAAQEAIKAYNRGRDIF